MFLCVGQNSKEQNNVYDDILAFKSDTMPIIILQFIIYIRALSIFII